MSFLNDFINLIFPRICPACGNLLLKNEKIICLKCFYDMPRTNFHLDKDNPVAQLFWGRVWIENATSLYSFQKRSRYQKLIHELKYNGRQEIGEEMGRIMGYELKNTLFASSDLVIPVPLHKKKLKTRGYNQSECIARGLSEVLEIPIDVESVIRIHQSETQTRKSRYERWENVEGIFEVRERKNLLYKHVLLVDDVVTTGSTLEACATVILQVTGTKVSIATLAVA